MAFCPNCRGVVDAAAVVCPHCGYDFPLGGPDPITPRRDLAHSTLANIALIVGIVAAGLGCIAAIVGGIVSLVNGELFTAIVVRPLAFFLQLAMLVVFVRVQRV
jgi:hypothetical protein